MLIDVAVIMPVKWNQWNVARVCKVIYIHSINKLKIKQMKTHQFGREKNLIEYERVRCIKISKG